LGAGDDLRPRRETLVMQGLAHYPARVMPTSSVRIYHNPRCSKSREALALLRQRGIEPEVVLYLETELGEAELKELVQKLGVAPGAILRRKEAAYAEAGLSDDSSLEQVVKAIREAPILLERPIVVKGERAAIGRPPEKVLELLEPSARRAPAAPKLA
jgi:arsenate reductase